jgi:uncharacterized repeat protein (TIGR03847 family)
VVETHRLDLGLVADLEVESFGEPGRRTFRILANTGQGTVSLWIEKEQVVLLGAAIEELLQRIRPPSGISPQTGQSGTFIGDLEVRTASLTLAYDGGVDGFALAATDFLSQLPIESIELVASREQLTRLEAQVEDIVSASRPRCVLCGTPLTGEAHFCAESNGHASVGDEG